MSTAGKKWKPGQLEKFQKTMAARKKAAKAKAKKPKVGLSGIPHQTKDAIIYLQHAAEHIEGRLKTGKLKKMDHAHLLTMLALHTLEGE